MCGLWNVPFNTKATSNAKAEAKDMAEAMVDLHKRGTYGEGYLGFAKMYLELLELLLELLLQLLLELLLEVPLAIGTPSVNVLIF